MSSPDPKKWFLQFSSTNYKAPNGDGRPWGDGTELAGRANPLIPGGPLDPWDIGCKVTTLIGGFEAMREMRNSLEIAMKEAEKLEKNKVPVGKRGYVYIADWRFNTLRDLSEDNDWKTDSWEKEGKDATAKLDQTAIGLVLRLMQKGILVRILVWYPHVIGIPAGFYPHMKDHFYATRIVQEESERLIYLSPSDPKPEPLGVMALDLRVAEHLIPRAAHHQKMMVIRVGEINVAFCGGVDLAYTRRDAPDRDNIYNPNVPKFLGGDWQSGSGITDSKDLWPQQKTEISYESVNKVSPPDGKQGSDLAKEEVYGSALQIWHDQHLKLEGPIVATIAAQFHERWNDSAQDLYEVGSWSKRNWTSNQVIFSTDKAIKNGFIVPLSELPMTAPPSSTGSSQVQMWRTIPLRERIGSPFQRGEFTVIAGIANACKTAEELIWIFDQYFWSRPLARLLNNQIREKSGLHVLIILPPYSDSSENVATHQHHARQLALEDLTANFTLGNYAQVGIYNLWHPTLNIGIYCHSKVQMYDGSLLVCGSANLNRRSFTGDTELACAVLDSAVVNEHQQKLWRLLFPDPLKAPWPELDLNIPGSGRKFFERFNHALGPPNAREKTFLIPDPWHDSTPQLPTVPKPVLRDQEVSDIVFERVYNRILESTSVNTKVEGQVRDASGILQNCKLDDIVHRLEKIYTVSNGQVDWPWRRS